MARSRRGLAIALAGALAFPAVLACNALIGLDDYNHAQCTGLVCADGGSSPDVDRPPDDSGRPDVVRVDAAGTQPVSWAAWPMPNYDAGDAGDPNPLAYERATDGIRDKVTLLVWQDPAPGGVKTLEDARKACTGTWRLPSRIELATLIDNSRTGVRIDPIFQGTQSAKYWTFSQVRRPQGGVLPTYWSVSFDTGGLAKIEATESAAVRCVKAIP